MKNICEPKIAITQQEKNRLLNLCKNPVCDILNCDELECDDCPFNAITDTINDAFHKVRLIAEKLPIYEEGK